jgi:putative endonuclease
MERKIPVVYMLANRPHGTLYLGVTSELVKRTWQHRNHVVDGFSKKYGCDKLVWYERHETMESAIVREKRIKRWRRQWKLKLIEKSNPGWVDLYESLF